MLADFVDGADVGVVQGGSSAGFPAEALQRLRVLSYVLGQKLQCDKAAKLGVLSLIDHTHAAATEFLDDTVVRNGLVDHWRRIFRWWSAQVNETREVGSVSKESLGNIPIVLIDPVVSVNPIGWCESGVRKTSVYRSLRSPNSESPRINNLQAEAGRIFRTPLEDSTPRLVRSLCLLLSLSYRRLQGIVDIRQDDRDILIPRSFYFFL